MNSKTLPKSWIMSAVAGLMLLGAPLEAQTNPPLVKVFGFIDRLESIPAGDLLQTSDGMLYGTTFAGGTFDLGCVYKLNTNGSGYTVIHTFDGNEGARPAAGLLEGSDGFLYGTTSLGGISNAGCVFRLSQDGSGYLVLHSFTGGDLDGATPSAELVEGTNGLLYGTTMEGGPNTNGMLFVLDKNGAGYSVLWNFSGTNGANPSSALCQGSDGRLYGVTETGGALSNGTVFAIGLNGSGFTNLWDFSGTNGDGAIPAAGLVADAAGVLYGVTSFGGSSNAGTVYRLNQDGSGYAILHSFSGHAVGDAENPNGPLKLASDGLLYGATLTGGTNDAGTLFKLNPDGNGYTLMHQFTGVLGEGRYPSGALLAASNGLLYGTTSAGGNGEGGTLFQLDPNASGLATLKQFYAVAGGDGFYPADPLLVGSDGKFYGTTVKGGEFADGTVFSMNSDGSAYQLLHSFDSTVGDGRDPRGGLVEGVDGGLYGITYSGGASNSGTIYRLQKDGSGYGVLLHFGSSTNDAQNPYAGVVQGSDGRLYGTTIWGGTNRAGTVFRLATNGTAYQILRSFGGSANSPTNPYCRMVEYATGTFYGTTTDGGANAAGTIFKLNQDGSGFSIVRSFNKNADTNGWRPWSGVIKGSDGFLYGVTSMSSYYGPGTLYRIAADGSGFSVLKPLTEPFSRAAFIEATDGNLYDVAYGEGSPGSGRVFRIGKDGGSYAVVRSFGSEENDGIYPHSALVQAGNGSLFGSTAAGGVGWGSVYLLPWQPIILGEPQSQIFSSGGSGVLGVGSAGMDPLSYQWWFNGLPIPDATNAVLAISPVTLADAGLYQVVVGNGSGNVTSVVASVTSYDSNWSANQFRFNVAGPLESGYRVEFRNDLSAPWNSLTNFTLHSSPLQISDTDSSALPQRFYRLVLLPQP